MSVYNITELNNELNILENTKNNIKNSLIDKGQNIADNRPFSNYVENIDALGTVHQFNTKAEMDTTTNLPKGTLGIVYSDYTYSEVDTVFTDSIYLPKKLSYTYNDISSLGNNYILGELEVDENTLYARVSTYDDGTDYSIIVTINGTNYSYVWTNNAWTRLDDDKGYREISINNNLHYRTYTAIAKEILEIKSGNNLGGIYLYGNMWNRANTQLTANASAVLDGMFYGANGVQNGTFLEDTPLSASDFNFKAGVYYNYPPLDISNISTTHPFWNNVVIPPINLASKTSIYTYTTYGYLNRRYNCQMVLGIYNTENLKSTAYMFQSDANLIYADVSKMNTYNVNNMSAMFMGCSSLRYIDGTNWDTSNVQNMYGMFQGSNMEKGIYGISNWNLENATNVANMFSGIKFDGEMNLCNWTGNNVINVKDMFSGARNLRRINLVNFKPNVNSYQGMFSNARNVADWGAILDISSLSFENVDNLSYMFNGCGGNLKLNTTSKYINASNTAYMFASSSDQITTKYSGWYFTNIKNGTYMYYNTKGGLSMYQFNTETVENGASMFANFSGYMRGMNHRWNNLVNR